MPTGDEKKSSGRRRTGGWAFLLALNVILFLISAAVILTLAFRPLYVYDMTNLKLAEETGYSEEEILENYDELIRYNLSPLQTELDFPTFPMSEEARIHFREVKRIFQGFLWLAFLSGILAAVGTIRTKQKEDFRYLLYTGVIGLGLPVFLGLLIAMNWERVFVAFHELVFANDYWLFDPVTDPIILVLPDEYFLHCALMILGMILAGAAGCLVLYRRRIGTASQQSESLQN